MNAQKKPGKLGLVLVSILLVVAIIGSVASSMYANIITQFFSRVDADENEVNAAKTASLSVIEEVESEGTARSAKIPNGTPMGRIVNSEELLGGAFFLCDDKAASAITGMVLPIDTGLAAYSGV